MTMKAVKKMTLSRTAEGSFGFEVDGDVVRAIFKNSGKAHNITLEFNKADLLAEVANMTAPAPVAPVLEPTVAPVATEAAPTPAEVAADTVRQIQSDALDGPEAIV